MRLITLFAMLFLLITGCAPQQDIHGTSVRSGTRDAAPIVLRVSTAMGSRHDQSVAFLDTFMAKMREDESLVRLEYIGGPEVIPNRRQGPAMKRGDVDIIMSPSAYYAPMFPEARLTAISNVSPQEWRRNGGYELMSRAWAQKMNAVILGWGNYYGYNQYFVWTVNKPKLSKSTGIDLSGVRMRSTSLYTPFLRKMGAIPKAYSPAEVYERLADNQLDGVAWPEGGVAFRGWQSFLKYRVRPGFFRSTTMITMNLDRFNSLPENARRQLRAAGLHYENNSGELLRNKVAIDNGKVGRAGVRDFVLPPEHARAYLTTIMEANWADAEKRHAYSVDFERLKSKLVVPIGLRR